MTNPARSTASGPRGRKKRAGGVATQKPKADAAAADARSRARVGKRSDEGWTQLNIFVPKNVRRRLKVHAAETEEELSEIVTRLLRVHLGMTA